MESSRGVVRTAVDIAQHIDHREGTTALIEPRRSLIQTCQRHWLHLGLGLMKTGDYWEIISAEWCDEVF